MTNDQMRNNHCCVGSSFGDSNLLDHSSFVIAHPAILSTSLDVTISSVRHGGDAALQVARSQSTEHILRLFSRLGAGCIRKIPAHVRDRANGRRLWDEH